MHAEDLIVDDHAQGEEVEHISEVMPDVGVAVFPHALSIESVGLRDTARLVVSSNKMHAMRVS